MGWFKKGGIIPLPNYAILFIFILIYHNSGWRYFSVLPVSGLPHKTKLQGGCSSDIASSYFSIQVKSRSMLHHGWISGGEFRINLTLTLTLNLLLLLPSIVFYNKICVFIMIFKALSFLRLIHGLFIRGNVS